MAKAFVDTTILADILLKSGESKTKAKAALARFSKTELPTYAIKEFKGGPLKNFIWMHNKLVEMQSFSGALQKLHGMSLTPRRYTTATAIEALQQAADSLGKQTSKDLEKKYGSTATLDQMLCADFRTQIKIKVFLAWEKRRKVTTDITLPLPCYHEAKLTIQRGQIDCKPIDCNKGLECCLKSKLIAAPEDLEKLKTAIELQSKKQENIRRSSVLGDLIRYPKTILDNKKCKNLGDAFFVFFAPPDSKILTTNAKDFEPMASALSKEVETP